MNKYVLVFFNDNYADEFDVRGHEVWERKKWDAHLSSVKEFLDNKQASYVPLSKYDRYEREVYFGTNEMMTYGSFKEYESAFKTKDLTDDQCALLQTLGLDEGGTFLTIDLEEDY